MTVLAVVVAGLALALVVLAAVHLRDVRATRARIKGIEAATYGTGASDERMQAVQAELDELAREAGWQRSTRRRGVAAPLAVAAGAVRRHPVATAGAITGVAIAVGALLVTGPSTDGGDQAQAPGAGAGVPGQLQDGGEVPGSDDRGGSGATGWPDVTFDRTASITTDPSSEAAAAPSDQHPPRYGTDPSYDDAPHVSGRAAPSDGAGPAIEPRADTGGSRPGDGSSSPPSDEPPDGQPPNQPPGTDPPSQPTGTEPPPPEPDPNCVVGLDLLGLTSVSLLCD